MKRFDVSDLVETNEQEPIEIRKLKKRIDELLHMLEEGQILELTRHGKVFGRVKLESEEKPYREQDKPKAFLTETDRLATQISAYAPEKVDAVEIVREMRRDFNE